MNKQDKDLLLKDLCARLPYGVKGTVEIEVSTGGYSIESGHLEFNDVDVDVELLGINKDTEDIEVYSLNDNIDLSNYYYTIYDFIPYLRPMSSMTNKEREEYRKFSYYGAAGMRDNDFTEMVAVPSFEKMDYLNSHHFDYRGLIEKGLALKAPEGMYDVKQEI